jgi:hypothetical protein
MNLLILIAMPVAIMTVITIYFLVSERKGKKSEGSEAAA